MTIVSNRTNIDNSSKFRLSLQNRLGRPTTSRIMPGTRRPTTTQAEINSPPPRNPAGSSDCGSSASATASNSGQIANTSEPTLITRPTQKAHVAGRRGVKANTTLFWFAFVAGALRTSRTAHVGTAAGMYGTGGGIAGRVGGESTILPQLEQVRTARSSGEPQCGQLAFSSLSGVSISRRLYQARPPHLSEHPSEQPKHKRAEHGCSKIDLCCACHDPPLTIDK